jgi:hypothetical protein
MESNPAASARSHSRRVSSKLACPWSGLSPIFIWDLVIASGCSSTAQKKLFDALVRVNVRELVEDPEEIKARPVGPASSCGGAGCSASVGDVKIPLLKK